MFFFPAASHVEKAGTFTQTQRMLQWREKAVEPPGDARSELWFFYHLGRILREKLAGSTDERDRPLLDLAWDYAMDGDEPSGEDVLRRISGVDLTTGRAVDELPRPQGRRQHRVRVLDLQRRLRRRGEPGGAAQTARPAGTVRVRVGLDVADEPAGALQPRVGRPAGPAVERAQEADLVGRRDSGEWTGHDVPDFEKTKPPDYRPPEGAVGVEALRGDDPFIMQADGKAWLFAPNGLLDGPLPTHYEPHESPVRNALYAQQGNPARKVYGRADNPSNPSPPEAHGEVFPFVFTAARLTEHHTAGGMSRQLPYLSELQPELFVEVSPELAAERGLAHLDWAHVITSRTAVEARVFVTDRMRPLRVEDRVVHQIWMPYHWGYTGLVDGDVVNDLLGVVVDPNVFIQESKVATCDVQPGRRPRGPALLEYIASYRHRAGITQETGSTSTPPGPTGSRTPRRRRERQQLLRAARRSGRRRRVLRSPAAGRLLHRHLGVHRVQGLRGGVQGMERGARRRVQPARDVVRQHRRAGRQHVAARRVHRAAAAAFRRPRHAGTRAAWRRAPAPRPARTSAG